MDGPSRRHTETGICDVVSVNVSQELITSLSFGSRAAWLSTCVTCVRLL